MLWSLLKVLIFVTTVALLTLGVGYLMDTDGAIRVAVGTTEFTLSPLAAVIGALVLLATIWLLFRVVGLTIAILKFLHGDETAITRFFLRNRERRGFEALMDGLMALASGEGRLALTKANRAEKYLNRPELTNLIAAQAAEMAGDNTKAEEVYKRLLKDDRTRFVGVRGIMKQKLATGDSETAWKLAEKAFALKPKHLETQDVLLRLQAEHHDWTGARATLAAKLKSGALPRDVHKRRDAVLTYAEARDALDGGDEDKATALALEANRLAPQLIPAAALAAELQSRAGKPRVATKIVKKAWETEPHPDLAAAFATIAPQETPAERLKRFEQLTQNHGEQGEVRMLMAELNIALEDFPAARRALGDLPETDPSARSLTIMAAIERGEGAPDHLVRAWLAKALTASRGPQWTCETCHNIHNSWVPVCSNCGAFDTLSWIEPPRNELSLTNSSDMLPLIVGLIEDRTEEGKDGIEDAVELVVDQDVEEEDDTQESPVEVVELDEEDPGEETKDKASTA